MDFVRLARTQLIGCLHRHIALQKLNNVITNTNVIIRSAKTVLHVN